MKIGGIILKTEKFKRYLYIGITAIAVVIAAIIVSFIFNNFSSVKSSISTLINILMPIIYGAGMTFLAIPTYDRAYNFSKGILSRILKNKRLIVKISKLFATLICLILFISIVTALIWMLIPQIIKSVNDMLISLPENSQKVYKMLENMLEANPNIEATVLKNYEQWQDKANNWLTTSLLPNLNTYIANFSNGLKNIIRMIFNTIIGLIVMVYLLNMKETMAAHAKKIIYGLFKTDLANNIVEECRYVKTVFSKFIAGKIIDSLIIGIINYTFMSILKMPYALVISVVIGVTNIVPFFGPFIGAIPCAFILLLVSPILCLQFIAWIIILQQVDGNIIGPKILGQTTGLDSFWILFSILLFGGLFGIAGMIIGVPTWAVIYRLISKFTNKLLNNKKLSTDSMDYVKLNYIDMETKEYIKNE